MPVEISDYLHVAYSSLPLAIGEVEHEVNLKGGQDVIHEKLGPIFRDHQVDEKYVC